MKNEKGYNEENIKKVRFLSNKTIKEINDWFDSDMPTKEELEKMIKKKRRSKRMSDNIKEKIVLSLGVLWVVTFFVINMIYG